VRLQDEIEKADEPKPEDREAKITLHRADINELDQTIRPQVLTLERYDKPNHPVALPAERRIEELHNRKAQLEEALAPAKAEPPSKPTPEHADIFEESPRRSEPLRMRSHPHMGRS